jgi:hypothetical protein
MSAVIMLKQRDRIHLMTDAASYYMDGTVAAFLDKCIAIPHLHCAIAALGPSLWGGIIERAISEAFSSYDEMKAGIEPLLVDLFRVTDPASVIDPELTIATDVWIVGWSKDLQGPDGFTIGMDDLDDWERRETGNPHAKRPFQIEPLHEIGINMNPCPSGAQLFEAFHPNGLPEPVKMIPDVDLVQLLEIQRRLTFRDQGWHFIGGYGFLTSVTADGINQRRVHSWPEDRVGEMIKPQPIDWLQWRAARNQSNVIELAHPNRRQRRAMKAGNK